MKSKIIIEFDHETRKGTLVFLDSDLRELDSITIKGLDYEQNRKLKIIRDEDGSVVEMKPDGPIIFSISMISDEVD